MFAALALCSWQAFAAPSSSRISETRAHQLEQVLQDNPNDRLARGTLLEYYLHCRANTDAIAARRKHILWFINNAPGDAVAGSPAAMIEPAGTALADPEGYKLASAAWRAQAAKPDATASVLINAANFFRLNDKQFAAELVARVRELTRSGAADPPERPPVHAAHPAPSAGAAASAQPVSADDLKKVCAGMSRQDVLRIGEPASRMTTFHDGHMLETFEYSVTGGPALQVRLTDGLVSSVQIP